MDDRTKGLVLAVTSSVFIGGSFIVKKKALRMSAVSGIRAGACHARWVGPAVGGKGGGWNGWWVGRLMGGKGGGWDGCPRSHPRHAMPLVHGFALPRLIHARPLPLACTASPCYSCTDSPQAYILPVRAQSSLRFLTPLPHPSSPCWLTSHPPSLVLGEFANFAAYAFAPAILVTPLGALSIIISAILAHMLLDEKLHVLGWLGATLCVVGSIAIVLHAPQEKDIDNVKQLWALATEPAFVSYSVTALAISVFLIFVLAPRYGSTNVLVYLAICSLLGSISVASCKALGIAVKLTLYGDNQLFYPETAFFAVALAACAVTQINYLNKSLDTFNTAVVTPIYYVMFTTLTIVASVIMYKDWAGQTGEQVLMEFCGFLTILIGTYLLHATKDFAGDSSRLHLFDPSARVTPAKNPTALKGHIGLGTMPSGGSKDDKDDLDPEAKPLL
ncbi:unnamed protein product [Closterium sp. NIES-64]|nr:unnamed protein product [Closterium sp. NIES-64]